MQEATFCLKWCWVSSGPSNFEAGHFIDSRNSYFLSWPETTLELAVGQTWRMNTVFPALPQSCKHSLATSSAEQANSLATQRLRKSSAWKMLTTEKLNWEINHLSESENSRNIQSRSREMGKGIKNTHWAHLLQSLPYFYFTLLLSLLLFCMCVWWMRECEPAMAWMWKSEGTFQQPTFSI